MWSKIISIALTKTSSFIITISFFEEVHSLIDNFYNEVVVVLYSKLLGGEYINRHKELNQHDLQVYIWQRMTNLKLLPVGYHSIRSWASIEKLMV